MEHVKFLRSRPIGERSHEAQVTSLPSSVAATSAQPVYACSFFLLASFPLFAVTYLHVRALLLVEDSAR